MILFARLGAEKFTFVLNGPFPTIAGMTDGLLGTRVLPLCEPWRLPLRILS